jgi:hypothetical protein
MAARRSEWKHPTWCIALVSGIALIAVGWFDDNGFAVMAGVFVLVGGLVITQEP